LGRLRAAFDGVDVPAKNIALRAAHDEIERLRAENADLKMDVIAFAGPWAERWARERDLPKDHLLPEHYDLLLRCGARMDSFTRAERPA
jgi:hypothetical protein